MPDPKDYGASARVTFTIEITLPDRWGADCTVGQIQRQARESAEQVVRRAFSRCDNHNGVAFNPPKLSIIGEPRVRCVVEQEDRG